MSGVGMSELDTANARVGASNNGMVESVANGYVCPNISTLDISADASFSTSMAAQKKVVITGIDAAFTYETVDDAESAALLNGFLVAGYGAGSEVDASNNALSVVMDPDANYSDGFKAILAKAILEAKAVAENIPGATAATYLKDGLAADLAVLANRLFNSQVTTVGITVTDPSDNLVDTIKGRLTFSGESVVLDASGGAANMWTDLEAVPLDPLNIYLQIPSETLALYQVAGAADDTPTTAALPMARGDSLTFVFNVASEAVKFTDAGNLGPDGVANVAPLDPGVSMGENATYARGPNQLQLTYNAPPRRLAFQIKLSGTAGTALPVPGTPGALLKDPPAGAAKQAQAAPPS
jgi:hypothetical protein